MSRHLLVNFGYVFYYQLIDNNDTMQDLSVITINRRKIKSLINNCIKSAEAINLVYVNDKQNGILRVKKRNGFAYTIDKVPVRDAETLARIKSLVLPPAWKNVWICSLPNGHLQATGIDANGRKQYRYHPLWSALRKETKFFHLHDFGINLAKVRTRVKADLALSGLPQQKVLAAVVALMESTGIRVGSNFYEKLYGSFGLTTLKNNHVTISGDKLTFSFKGKKGVYHDITLKSRKLARIVQQCRDIPGKELFRYYDDKGISRSIDSGMVNQYIKDCCGHEFTAKDFRTWTGTVAALEALIGFGHQDTAGATNKKIVAALDVAAKRLGNTRTVCKKYYVHPTVVECYANNTLHKYLQRVPKITTSKDPFSYEEKVLMKMLDKVSAATLELAKAG